MSLHPALRLTPSNSPFQKASITRSPTKAPTKTEEPGLHLKKVIGTTTASANGFDCLPGARQFAFTAGAAAVLATVDDDLNIQQQFFRANPLSASGSRDGTGVWPITPSPGDRSRTPGYFKDQNGGASPLGATLRDWSDSPSGRTVSAKDRVKAATSVALSPNGKWLALGETGYRPRILIFSAKDGSSETPIAVVAEHTFGVHALSFSPDSKFLASLGTVNDGFLYIWSIDERTGCPTLYASNKCTTTIHAMSWMGRNVVTVGLRFIKVWRPDEEATLDSRGSDTARTNITPRPKADLRSDFGNSILSPKHKVLAGKNCLLGEMLEATFISVLAFSDCKALICAEGGEVCLLDDSDRTQNLTFATTTGIRITAAMIDGSALRVVGADDSVASFDISELEKRATMPARGSRRSSSLPARGLSSKGTTIVATATVGDVVIMIDSNRMISLSKAGSDNDDNDEEILHRHLTAHDDAVLGVRAFRSRTMPGSAFFTFSGNGTVRFWDDEGCAVGGLTAPVESSIDMYGQSNELRAVASSDEGDYLVTGDKFGTMTLFNTEGFCILQQVRAHSTEILDITGFVRNGVQFFASASRDRTVQLFACTSKRLDLLQTMDEHAGAVSSVLSARDGDQLLSCSSDRSVVVREAVLRDPNYPKTLAYGMLRTISLKSSPTSMCLTPEDNMILVSAVDRCISKYSTKSGQSDFCFKCSDNEGGEAVVMSKIIYAPSLNGNPTIAGISSSDKSVRLYTEYGTLIARDWGHTEGVTDIAFIPPPRREGNREYRSPHIATVAADSTIFMWESVVQSNRSATAQSSESAGSGSGDAAPEQPSTLMPLGPPLRKVISYSEMSRFRREKLVDENDPPSPNALSTSPMAVSPHKLRKKASRPSFAQAPRLEPAFRSSFRDSSRRRTNRHQSPSPPSPKAGERKDTRRTSLGMSLRSKSTDNILHTTSSNAPPLPSNAGAFGSLAASTDSVCRTLRAYRKKLSNSTPNDTLSADIIRELEKELKLTARVVGEKSAGKTLDEAIMTKLLDQASDKIIGMLDEKIKERVEGQARKGPAVVVAAASSPSMLAVPEQGLERSETTPPGF